MKRKPTRAVYSLTYAQIKTGQAFLIPGSYGSEVAFMQTKDNRTWPDYYGNGGKGFNRPLPTRLWDGTFLGLDDNTPARVVTIEEARACAIAYRRVTT